MNVEVRSAVAGDIDACGRIMYRAFQAINDRHGFENTDFPSVDVGRQVASFYINNPMYYGVVAETDGQVVGSNFLDERSVIRGVATLTVDPDVHGKGVGRTLMQHVLERSRDCAGVRLLQHAFNTASMTLYSSLGFEVKEPVMLMTGKPTGILSAEHEIRPMSEEELIDCGALCRAIHGFDRTHELRDALRFFSPYVALRGGRIVAYASAADSWAQNHGVARTEEDMQALLLGIAAAVPTGLALLLPIRKSGLFRWCLSHGLRAVKPMTLMATGDYQDPDGPYFTSVVF